MNEKVSIVIPAYNAAAYIPQTLDSVVKQTYKNIEIIVVNDGSHDNTTGVVNAFMNGKDVEWRVVEKENGGQSSARNLGAKCAGGGYIMFVDSDDYINENYVERQLDAIRSSGADFAACPFQNVHEADFERSPEYDNGNRIYDSRDLAYLYLHRKICLIAPALLVKKEILAHICFDEACPYDEDGLFVWSLLYKSKRGAYCDVPMYNYRVREGSVMHSLTADKCHQSILCYTRHCEGFAKIRRDEVTSLILPNHKLASQHVLAKNVRLEEFKTEYKRTDRKDIKRLLSIKDIRLTLLAISYLTSPRLFYQICKRM